MIGELRRLYDIAWEKADATRDDEIHHAFWLSRIELILTLLEHA